MNAPLWIPNSTAPKPGAILLTEDSPLGRAGQYIELDARGGGVINLSNGALLPMAGGRQGMQFAGAPPGVADVHTPIAIAGYLAGYKNKRFLLDTVVQEQPVDFTQFKYRSFNTATTYLVEDAKASTLSTPAQTQFTSAVSDGATEDLRMATFIPWRTDQQADFPFTQAAARNLHTKIMLYREYTAFASGSLFMTSGSWDSAVRLALAGDQNWGPPGSEGADSDPIRDLRDAVANSLEPIDFFVMNLIQFQWFTAHPKVVDYYKAFNPQGNTRGMMADAVAAAGDPQRQNVMEFDVPLIGKILVHDVRATTSAAVAPTRFWPNDIVLGFHLAANMPPNAEVATAINFRLKNPVNGSAMPAIQGAPEGVPTNNGWRVRMVPVPLIGSGGDLMIVDLSEKWIMTASNAGAYITGIS